jgi:hypothetical protein
MRSLIIRAIGVLVAVSSGGFAQQSVAAPEAGSAQVLAQQILKRLNDFAAGKNPGGFEQFCADFCDTEFEHLVDHANDKEGVLDYDPFCQCQDVGGVYKIRSVTRLSADEYQVRIIETKSHTDPSDFVLRPTAHGWKVYDLIETGKYGEGSLRRRLINPD